MGAFFRLKRPLACVCAFTYYRNGFSRFARLNGRLNQSPKLLFFRLKKSPKIGNQFFSKRLKSWSNDAPKPPATRPKLGSPK